MAIQQGGILLFRNSEPHFAGERGFCNSQKSVENTHKSACRGAKRRGGRTTTYNLAPSIERNPNFFQGKSASGFLNPAQRFRPPPLRYGKQNRKFSKHFFNRPLAKFFQLRKRKFFCFDILLTQNCGNASRPQSDFAGQQAGKNSFPPDPLFFLPACLGFALKNFEVSGRRDRNTKRRQ